MRQPTLISKENLPVQGKTVWPCKFLHPMQLVRKNKTKNNKLYDGERETQHYTKTIGIGVCDVNSGKLAVGKCFFRNIKIKHVSMLQYSNNSILFLFYIFLCVHYYRSTDDVESDILVSIQYDCSIRVFFIFFSCFLSCCGVL